METEIRILSAPVFFACVLIVILLVTHPEARQDRNKFLVVLFSFLAFHQFLVVLQVNGVISFAQQALPSVLAILVYAPSLWFYIRDIKGKKTRYWLHYGVWMGAFLPLALNLYFKWMELPFLLTTIYLIALIIYLILSIREIRSDDFLQSKQLKNWVRYCVYAYIAISSIYLIEGVLIYLDINLWFSEYGIWASRYYFWMHLIFCGAVILKMANDPSLFVHYKIIRDYRTRMESISENELRLLTDLVVKNRLFLNAELTRTYLAQQSGLTINRISEIVNGHFKTNFSEWINDLRIDEAKRLLENESVSIKEVLYATGFNSKSAFNKAFKRRTAFTPSDYRLALVRRSMN